jgi:lipid-A-disaccharide synthase
MRRTIDRLLCIFPFEQGFFRKHGIPAEYIGHPMVRLIQPSASRAELRQRYQVADEVPMIALLPGSRKGEVGRHLPYVLEAARAILAVRPARFVLSLPEGFSGRSDLANFRERFSSLSIQVREGETWDILACADLALAASGTVTIEACLLQTPMITFYRVNPVSWLIGKALVRVPFYSMVNLIAGRKIVPELIQERLSGRKLAEEAMGLLNDGPRLQRMRSDLDSVAHRLRGSEDPLEAVATAVEKYLKEESAHV